MLPSDIAKLGLAAYSRSIHPLRSIAVSKYALVGFDTEYDSKKGKLLSFQLWAGKRGAFVASSKLTPDMLLREAIKLLDHVPPGITFVSYFSLAELQFLPVVTDAIRVREFARGSLDVEFAARHAKGNVPIEIFDLCRWFDFQSLANAAKSMGFEKLEWNRKHVTSRDLKSRKFREYALNDARITWGMADKLREEFAKKGIDMVTARTAASASSQVFRLHHVEEKFYCDENRARLAALKGTWGGRTETYKRGRIRHVWEYDLPSAYPNAALRLGVMPVAKSWHECHLGNFEKRVGGFARVRFKFPDDVLYPCLPVVTEDSQLYPLAGETWATFAEVQYALTLGARVKWMEGWGYRTGTTALKDYMEQVLAERAKATGARKVMLKLLANSLIGKFAQRVDRVGVQELFRCAEANGMSIDDFMELNRDEQKALGLETQVNVGSVWMPEWNGLITGLTRRRLSEMVVEGRAVYSATDAVWVDRPQPGWKDRGDCKRDGPATLARTRLAAIWSDPAHVVHHSVWNRKSAETMLREFTGARDVKIKYPIRRPLKFREAVKKKRVPGVWVEEWRTADTHWDGKRVLLERGETRPWKDLAEYVLATGRGKKRKKELDTDLDVED